MRTLPRAARAYILAIWALGLAALLRVLFLLHQAPPGHEVLAQAALFIALALVADLKHIRLGQVNYSVATATNFACVILLGPEVATCVGAIGAAAGDVVKGKPAHKVAFNASALGLSVAAGANAMQALRVTPLGGAPSPADLPAFITYALTNTLVNLLLVSIVVALVSRRQLSAVLSANFRGVGVPIVALYPLGILCAIVYAAFGGWVGLLLLVLPVVVAYVGLEHGRRLRDVHRELRLAHDELGETHSQLRETHEQLKATQEQVVEQERLRALGQMASGVAHDFNNALAPVIGFSELLLIQPEHWQDEPYMRETLGLIHTSARDAANVVRQLRQFYRKPDQAEDEILLPLDLNALVQQAVDITQPRWRDQAQASGATIEVRTDLRPLPPIMGEESAVREVLANLIFNAVDAMPRGGAVTLRTRTEEGELRSPHPSPLPGGEGVLRSALPGGEGGAGAEAPAPRVVLEVVDTGTGMTEAVRQRCLDPFFTTKGANGTGMGLAMVQGIIRRHDGTLDVESAWGHGTTIRIDLPGCASQQPAPTDTPAPDAAEPEHVPAEPAAPLRVLVVDDEPTVRQVVAAYIASYGYVSETAVDGHQGLLAFRAAQFDVVITDRAMPNMNGDHFAQAVKQINASVPVIMLTGFGDHLNAVGELPAHVDCVLGKPVRRADLREALDVATAKEASGVRGQVPVTAHEAPQAPEPSLLALDN